jgi:hypothetical protein
MNKWLATASWPQAGAPRDSLLLGTACSTSRPLLKGHEVLVELPPPAYLQPEGGPATQGTAELQPYLLGSWAGVVIDPNMWQVGRLPVSHFTVRNAALRLRLLKQRRADPAFSLLAGHRPRLWADMAGQQGLAALEAGWAEDRVDRWRLLTAARVRRRGRGQAAPATAGPAASGALEAPGAPRVHPLQRAAAAGTGVAGHGADEVDVLVVGDSGTPQVKPPWLAAYAALQDSRLDRITRHFGWRLLHGALRCGAASVQWQPADSEGALWAAVCCPSPGCAQSAAMPNGHRVPALADYSHVFLHCPSVQPAVDWLCNLWGRIAPADAPVPRDVRVLLLGDAAVWSPAGGEAHRSLWLHLRLLWCRAVWARTCAASPGEGLSWRAVVGVLRAWVSRAIRLDWLRVCTSLPGAADLPSWCVLSDRCHLTQERFQDRWCIGAVLAHVDSVAAGGPAALSVHVPP